MAREREVCDFVRVYVFDWHVLSALAVPLIFSALFPVYWILICPEIWHRHPGKTGKSSFLKILAINTNNLRSTTAIVLPCH